MSAEIVQNWLIAISLVVTTIVTIVMQVRMNTNNKKTLLNQQLFEIQRLAFINPHVDNEDYTTQWNDLKNKYQQGMLKDRGLDDFLKYDVYTEMIYNYLEMSISVFKSEKKLLNYVDFKSWINIHAQNWKNPLKEHSNTSI